MLFLDDVDNVMDDHDVENMNDDSDSSLDALIKAMEAVDGTFLVCIIAAYRPNRVCYIIQKQTVVIKL